MSLERGVLIRRKGCSLASDLPCDIQLFEFRKVERLLARLVPLLLSVPVFSRNDAEYRKSREARIPIDETLFPANPARLPVPGRGLEFPVRNTKAITKIRAYGIRPWGSEPVHNGIDIVVDNSGALLSVGDRVAVQSSTAGTVREIIFDRGTQGEVLVIIEVNPGLYVNYNLEPETEIGSLRALQAASIDVVVGQRVRKKQKIADLVVGEGEEPHLDHSMLLFDPALVDPEDPIGDLLTMFLSHDDVADLPTFLCPYDYSSLQAKTTYEEILRTFDPASQCTCPCRFPYNPAECGFCGD